MREIKFRAWCKKDKMMYYDIVYGIEFEDGSKYNFCNFIGSNDQDDYHEWVSMQYTGLKDKNGKAIYEGDVLKHKDDRVSSIEYDAPHFILRHHNGHDGTDFPAKRNVFEVIGNIYSNPELLHETA